MTLVRRLAGPFFVFAGVMHFVIMVVNPGRYAKGTPGGRASLIARLPFQLVFIGWVRAAMRSS